MSKVFSFRLSEVNPREIQAREVIEAWVGEGYSIRHIVVEALLNFNDSDKEHKELDKVIDQIKELIIMLNDNHETYAIDQQEKDVLPEAFILAIKKSIKKGIPIE
jgi:hypothetical protein